MSNPPSPAQREKELDHRQSYFANLLAGLIKAVSEKHIPGLPFNVQLTAQDDARRYERELRDFVAALSAGWQPIETAPKAHKEYVLLYWPHWGERPFEAYWYNGEWYAERVLDGMGPGPTHWMPLPAPPEISNV